MADFTALKEAIQDAIKQNGQKEITGEVLQTILLSMVSTLGDSAINDLVAALAAAVTALQNSVGDEATARQSAVATLTQNLNTEAQTRAYEDSQLANAIQGEAYLRGQSDNQIRQDFTEALNEETAARINGDSTLTHNLNVEAQARAAAILNEATIRQGEDYQLRLQINGLSMNFDDLLEDVRNLIRNYNPIIINGDVTNAPDENDLTTTSNNLLKFKDNVYNPIIFSGMGKKFLRKNLRPLSTSYDFDGFVENINPQEELSGTPAKIFWDREGERFVGWLDGVYYLAWTDDDAYVPVSTENIYMYDGNPYKWNGEDFYVDDEELPNVRNVLTQDMINEANTIYVIRYDYTLAEDITIPANCVLEFDGGSISNGTIVGNETILVHKRELEDILNNVTFSGTFVEQAGGNTNKKDNVNGMGKIYLRKDKSFESQLTQENTIYVIQYDFDLKKEVHNITIPNSNTILSGGYYSLVVNDNNTVDINGRTYYYIKWNLKKGYTLNIVNTQDVVLLDNGTSVSSNTNVTASNDDIDVYIATSRDASSGLTITNAYTIGKVYYYTPVTVQRGTTLRIADTDNLCLLDSDFRNKAMGSVLNPNNYIQALDEDITTYIASLSSGSYTDAYIIGSNITIPSNCVLSFDGGSISNGTLIGDDTRISAGDVPIFTAISFSGAWNCPDVRSRWISDIGLPNNIRVLFDLTSDRMHNNVYIERLADNAVYNIAIRIEGLSVIIPNSNTDIYLNGHLKITETGVHDYKVFRLLDKKNISICGGYYGKITGDMDISPSNYIYYDGVGSYIVGHGISVLGCKNILFRGLNIVKVHGDSIIIDTPSYDYTDISEDIIIENCIFEDAGRQGITVHAGKRIKILNCTANNINYSRPSAGINIENLNKPSNPRVVEEVSIENYVVNNCRTGLCVIAETPMYNISVKNYKSLNCQRYGFICRYAVTGLSVDNSIFECKTDTLLLQSKGTYPNDYGTINIKNSIFIFSDTTESTEETSFVRIDRKNVSINSCKFITSASINTNRSMFEIAKGRDGVMLKDCDINTFYLKLSKVRGEMNNCNIKTLSIMPSDNEDDGDFNNKFSIIHCIIDSTNRIMTLNENVELYYNTITAGRVDSLCHKVIGNTFITSATKDYFFGEYGTPDSYLNDIIIKDNSFNVDSVGNAVYANYIVHFTYCKNVDFSNNIIGLKNSPYGFRPQLCENVMIHNNVWIKNADTEHGETNGEAAHREVFYHNFVLGQYRNRGEFSEKPTFDNSSIYIGFEYMIVETNRHMPIYYGGDSKWYDAAGNEVTA